MTSTIDHPGPFDALQKARPGEGIFALLERDPCSPAAITEWARTRRNRAFKLYGGDQSATAKELLAAELSQCFEAELIALEWAEGAAVSAPVEGQRAAYQEVIKSAEELAEADRRKRRETAVRDLREAAYHLCEAKDALIGLGLIPEATAHDLVLMLDRINGLADEHRERRG